MQIEAIVTGLDCALKQYGNRYTVVFRRFFLSDSANQADLLYGTLGKRKDECATSVIEQAPLNNTKIALWAYAIENAGVRMLPNGLYEVKAGSHTHYWCGTRITEDGDSEKQSYKFLSDYATDLQSVGLTLENDCIRTWFFVQNVDVNYAGVVKARNDIFALHNLTPQTHFISSTGIGGRNKGKNEIVQFNAYAVEGLQQGQIRFLYAKDHLNPTYEYGVSFERGTCVDYADRRHIFISGTASIDNKGNVLHVGEIEKQVHRMWENVEALLKEGGCGFEDVAQMLVYLRDPADYPVVKQLYDQKFPGTPKVILLAPVCRPAWLIEMECMAVKQTDTPQFSNF